MLLFLGYIDPFTMPSDSDNPNTTHILHFFYDNEDSCALTVLINEVRFHIIVDPEDLRKSSDKNLYYEYLDNISGLREAEEREAKEAEQARSKSTGSKKRKRSNDKDSAIHMDDEEGDDGDQDSGSAGVELRNWILSAFADVTAIYAPLGRPLQESTLYEWYHGPTYFYDLKIQNGELTPELLEENDDLTKRIESLVPRLKMPKYVQQMDLPWLDANDLTVTSEVANPEPAHPGKVVTKSGQAYFFKPVDDTQPNSFKREIKILRKLQELDLAIKVPKLLGFVGFENSKTDIMGLLLSVIEDPTPLTKLLDAGIDEDMRTAWSEKSEAYVKLLHENNIIWGDAKADNFMVDKNDELWIIDFGGSYTEGWVDPELNETLEGDEMGVHKIQAALEDPEANTFDPASSISETHNRSSASLFVTEKPMENKKRAHEAEESASSKQRRRDGQSSVGRQD